MGRAILLTGVPGVGKTTLIRRVVDELEAPAGGFYTRELREQGRRVGFEIVTLDGQRGLLSHIDIRGRQRVGTYGVDTAALDDIGVASIERAIRNGAVVVIDEIGPMELLSERFQEAVVEACESDSLVLGTIARRRSPFTDTLKAMPDVSIVEVTRNNRDTLASEILKLLT